MSGARRVYSTGPEGPVPESPGGAGRNAHDPPADLAPAGHALRVRLERSGRKGRQVTVVGPLQLRQATARELLVTLKRRCGTGGTLKPLPLGEGAPGFELEIQGDQRERLCAELSQRGYPVRR